MKNILKKLNTLQYATNNMNANKSEDQSRILQIYLDDIKNIREELNWRVKIAYTSNITVFPGLAGLASFLLSRDLDSLVIFTISSILSLILSMYVNLQVFNRMVEKKIEAYILSIQKKIKNEFHIQSHSWISFLYGEASRFSIIGYLSLFYQYIFPNIISLIILLMPVIKYGFENIGIYLILLTGFAFLLNILSFVLIYNFIIYFKGIRRAHHEFYHKGK